MTTIRLQSAVDVDIVVPEGLSQDMLEKFSPLNRWLTRLIKSLAQQHTNPSHPFRSEPYALRQVKIQSFDLFGGERIGFLKLQADVRNARDEHLPGSIFLRGPSVAMLVLLVPDDVEAGSAQEGEERRVILTVQPRVPAGSLGFVELRPAWWTMAHLTNLSDLAGEAIQKGSHLQQQEGSGNSSGSGSVDADEDLPDAVYPSAGGCDEFIPVFVHERRVPRSSLDEWTGKLTGLRDDGEKITLKLAKMKDLWKEGRRDAKCLAAVALWEGLKREGKL
ncbi:hypothetical protein G7054_g5226 [Neopestalotiopsis clavispora]|nr:hypothetical protein G7054_g5226 [Neopestalotiopsis clavispora]